MLVRIGPRQLFEELVNRFEPIIRKSFLDAVNDITSNIVLRRVVELLEKGDVLSAIEALHLDPAAFRQLDDAVRQTFNGGGVATVADLPILRDPEGHRIVIRWDARNLEAEAWLKEHSSSLISEIVSNQREGVRAALQEGLARGDNPTRTALNLVGRVSRATGLREGGVIGLTAKQIEAVERARLELSSLSSNYFSRARRDKRFDAAIREAIKNKRPLSAEAIDRIVGRYSDGLLKLRADTIALHETFTSLNEAKVQSFKQAIDKGALRADVLTKRWHSRGDDKVRHSHQVMNGQKVGFDGVFVSPSGAMLRFPHDPTAPPEEIIGCRCWMEVKADFVKQRYGQLV